MHINRSSALQPMGGTRAVPGEKCRREGVVETGCNGLAAAPTSTPPVLFGDGGRGWRRWQWNEAELWKRT